MRIRTTVAAFTLAAAALVTAAGSAAAYDAPINVNVNNGKITNVNNGKITNVVCNAENSARFNLAFSQTALACNFIAG